MNLNQLYNQISRPNDHKVENNLYFVPLIPAVLWIIFSIISLFTIDFTLIKSPFVIISIISRVLFSIFSIKFIKNFYIKRELKTINYNHLLNFIGYSISITYVSYMLPGVVSDFNISGSSSPVFTIIVFLSTLCPLALYLMLKSPKIKYASGYFTSKEIDLEKKMKKDKPLKKANQKLLRGDRNIIQNIWFEALDPLMWAILWVLIINNSLFQLYQIPSSSMVPEFLEQDRVVASKLLSGPRIPLTNFYLPEISKPKAGQIVTFNNPKVDDPTSDLKYKNVFTRIFQPFVFMLTFANIDIDADENGYPKARQLVKRVIAVPGEKLCIVNDKVYKKTKDMDWTLMSEIPGEKEWGRADLFELDNKISGTQYINPALRAELDEAANLALNSNIKDIEELLVSEKAQFLDNLTSIDKITFLNTLMSYNRQNVTKVTDMLTDLEESYGQMMRVNRATASNSAKSTLVNTFNQNLDDYIKYILIDKVNDLGYIVQQDRSEIIKNFYTSLELPNDPSPYDIFITKLDGLEKLNSLKLYNEILKSGEFKVDSTTLHNLKIISLYTNGLQYIQSFFGAGNLPEFPAGEGNYIPEDEYFLLGDNRYNSLDSRMGDSPTEFSLDKNNSEYSDKIIVGWDPHTYNEKYIHGKVRVILFPFNHFKLFVR